MSARTRDPRTHPKPGDVLQRLKSFYRVVEVQGERIVVARTLRFPGPRSQRLQPGRLSWWIRDMSGAAIVQTAREDA
mgnify:CR=1 FL=1